MAKQQSAKLSGKNKTILPDYHVTEWNGLNTYIKDLKDLADGETPDELNWVASKEKDHIELRRGYALLGTTRNAGLGRITGLGIATRSDQTQVPFFSYNQKIIYYDAIAGNTVESGSNALPAAANGDDLSFMPYENIAGAFIYITSVNSSIYKIAAANPGSVIDLLSTAFRGHAKIGNNRMFLWNRNDTYNNKYLNDLLIGVSDKSSIAQYPQATGDSENMGDGTTTTFSGISAINSKYTLFNFESAAPIAAGVAITGISQSTQAIVNVATTTLKVGNPVLINGVNGMIQINNVIGIVEAVSSDLTQITLSINSSAFSPYTSGGEIYLTEYFNDDKNGNLTSSLGGTGTINYATGAHTQTFNTPPLAGQAIFNQFYYEDATNGGVADFTVNGAVTGQGKLFPQYDGGGSLMSVFPFDQTEYCFHVIKTWYLSLMVDDTKATNLPYRSNLGIPYFRAAYPTDDGIVFLDNSHPVTPKFKILEVDNANATSIVTVVPEAVSEQLDLSAYGFSQGVAFRFGDYDLLACQDTLNGIVQSVNTIFFLRNIYTGQWDKLDYPVSCLAEYLGTLLSGDSLSNNVFTLFSGTDDDNNLINNYYTTKQYNLGIEGIKRTNRFVVRGLIQQTQNIDCYFSFDSGNFVKLCTVQGNGTYVNIGQPTTVGSSTLGSNVVGGGGIITAYPFEVEFTIASDIYEYVQVEFQANNIGFVQINEFVFKDNRYKGRHVTPSRTIVYNSPEPTPAGGATWDETTATWDETSVSWDNI